MINPFSFIIASLFIVISFNSCKPETIEDAKRLSLDKDFKVIKVKSNYEIKVMDYMISTNILNNEASLQYMSPLKEEYIIIINEPKQEFIEAYLELNAYDKKESPIANYSTIQLAFFNEKMKPSYKSKLKHSTINNLSVEYIELNANIAEVNQTASYFIYYIASLESLYTIMTWTLKQNKDVYREKVRKMIRTFKVDSK